MAVGDLPAGSAGSRCESARFSVDPASQRPVNDWYWTGQTCAPSDNAFGACVKYIMNITPSMRICQPLYVIVAHHRRQIAGTRAALNPIGIDALLIWRSRMTAFAYHPTITLPSAVSHLDAVSFDRCLRCARARLGASESSAESTLKGATHALGGRRQADAIPSYLGRGRRRLTAA